MVIDSDLEGSTGLKAIHQKHPDVFVSSGIMERGNFSAAAGFGFDPEKFGVFSTFAAFLEMCISEVGGAEVHANSRDLPGLWASTTGYHGPFEPLQCPVSLFAFRCRRNG